MATCVRCSCVHRTPCYYVLDSGASLHSLYLVWSASSSAAMISASCAVLLPYIAKSSVCLKGCSSNYPDRDQYRQACQQDDRMNDTMIFDKRDATNTSKQRCKAKQNISSCNCQSWVFIFFPLSSCFYLVNHTLLEPGSYTLLLAVGLYSQRGSLYWSSVIVQLNVDKFLSF